MSQIETVLSADPETKKFVKGWKLSPFTESVCCLNCCLTLRVCKSYSLIAPSPPADSAKSPVSWNLTLQIGAVCTFVKVCARPWLMKSQSFRLRSLPAVIR